MARVFYSAPDVSTLFVEAMETAIRTGSDAFLICRKERLTLSDAAMHAIPTPLPKALDRVKIIHAQNLTHVQAILSSLHLCMKEICSICIDGLDTFFPSSTSEELLWKEVAYTIALATNAASGLCAMRCDVLVSIEGTGMTAIEPWVSG